MSDLDPASFASMVDHTLLAPEATPAAVDDVVDQAARLSTASVCLNGYWVARAADRLGESGPAVCTVVGFPLGAGSSDAKAHEAAVAIADGAREVDMVVNLGALVAGETAAVTADIAAVRDAVADRLLKVILETAALDSATIVAGCEAAERAGADYVKTSTGFHSAGGASVEAVELMAATVGDRLGVKASGGIRTLADVEAMVGAGATRLGMSATMAVLDELGGASD